VGLVHVPEEVNTCTLVAIPEEVPVPPFATATVPLTLPADVADVAVAALPVMFMPHVPLAPVPVGEGTLVPITEPIADLAAAASAAINTASPTVVEPKLVLVEEAVAVLNTGVPLNVGLPEKVGLPESVGLPV
jgi:hypothetical protein